MLDIIGSGGFIGSSIIKSKMLKDNPFRKWSSKSIDPNRNFDLYKENTWRDLLSMEPKNILFVSWPSLPGYNQLSHIEYDLTQSIKLTEQLIENGAKKIIYLGTCYEYGLQNGCLSESIPARPQNFYSLAKNSLREASSILCKKYKIEHIWCRIFFPYGIGQNPNSLYPSLIKAIKTKEKYFNVSNSKLIRDFIHVDSLSKMIVSLCLYQVPSGIYNIGSGKPLSISEFIKSQLSFYKYQLDIREGFYPVREDEPKEYWANIDKINKSLKNLNLCNN